MTRTIRVGAKLAITCFLVAGCSITLVETQDGAPVAERQELPVSEQVRAVCEAERLRCEKQIACGAPIVNRATTLNGCYDEKGCLEQVAGSVRVGAVLRADNIAACRASIEAADCATEASRTFHPVLPCMEMLEGRGAEGDACDGQMFANGGCQTGLWCNLSDSCPGRCESNRRSCVGGDCAEDEYCSIDRVCEKRAAIGQACELSNYDLAWERHCEAGAFCDEDREICVPSVEAGRSCPETTPYACLDGFVCTAQDGEPGATCQSEPGKGDPCSGHSLACGPRLSCVEEKCMARGSEGQSCVSTAAFCEDGLACGDEDKCVPWTAEAEQAAPELEPLLEVGDRCGGRGRCPLGTVCSYGTGDLADDVVTCRPAPRLGEGCTLASGIQGFLDPRTCAEGYCDIFATEVCVAPQPPGAACSAGDTAFTFECASAFCRDHVCVDYADLQCGATA